MSQENIRYNLPELTGTFGDHGTLTPFVAAYISVLSVDLSDILLTFGSGMIVVGFVYRTLFPAQPMKAIGAADVAQAG